MQDGLIKSYETKQYKKGLKAAEAILKKFPNHGETLAMKGLTLNCMGRKSEAYDLVRIGLKNDLKSHVCWHVYGLLYRSDREYREAIKCYRNALRIDPDNIEILRDLSLLQAQMRDLTGFVETRLQLLTLKPNHRMNWIGFAVAQHLNSNASKAVDILEAYEGTLEDDYPPENECREHGEMLLYKGKGGVGFIKHNMAFAFEIVKYMSNSGFAVRYYEGLQRCLGLYSEDAKYSSDEIDRLAALYESLAQQYHRSSAVKGVPSLFSDLSPLYDHPEKAEILEQLVLKLEHSVRTNGSYPGSEDKEPPSTLMWTLFYLAQHYDRRGEYDAALSKIDEAIEHTPTVIDLYLVKSRILKHAGDIPAAAALADEARCMDLADRYLNSECVKRMLQADQVAFAEKTAVLFTKDGDQHNNLYDMQCMWYEIASGESYLRQGDLGRALKKFLAVEKHYSDITEDQFDFHSYCLRKMTLRTYVEMLKLQDRLHSYAYFRKAAAGAIRCYLRLYDSPSKSAYEEDNEMSKLPSAQKKKLRQKQRKAEARAKKEAEVKSEESCASGVSKLGKRQVKAVDPDPNGDQLLQVEDPLVEATKYLKLLQKHSPDSLETHLLSYEVNIRKQKILLALQAVKHLVRLDADSPDSHRCLIKFFHKAGSLSIPVTDAEKLVCEVLEAERLTFSQLQGKTLIDANRTFLEKHKDSLIHRTAVAESLHVLEPNKKADAVKLIEDSAMGPISMSSRSWMLKDCIAVHKCLDTNLDDRDAALRWKERCAEYFPYSTYFGGSRSSVTTGHLTRQTPENGAAALNADLKAGHLPSNGILQNLDGLKDLVI
ncbi:unnamed protein product [Cuscuta campestris]|uniref:Uncharacterized protein n=1 Tax=Cuscuta campestris TaxID=132261 RepID=A0A484MF60_9ASTE|nr:unnamed protein product [Cuscuta campestris]